MGEPCGIHQKDKNVDKVVVRKPEWKIHFFFGTRRRWVDDIVKGLKKGR
jgi:hypothetical protein